MKVSWVFVLVLLCPAILNAKKYVKNQSKREDHFCIVEENEKQMKKFDFTKLSNVYEDYVIKRNESDGGTVYVQLCSSLRNKCNGQPGYSICVKKKDKEIGIGKSPPRVEFKSSRITFNFIGEKCNSTSNYTTIIIMQCDYNASGNTSFPQIIPHAEDQCDIYLTWSTIYACSPMHRTNCSVTDNSGYEYDLSSLTLLSYNYKVPMNKSQIILNVCHSIIYGNGAACKQKSASCLWNVTAGNDSFLNLGEVGNPPFIDDDGILKIEYNEGDVCIVGTKPHIKTVIAFMCDSTAENTLPKYVYGSEICTYYLEWNTPLACKEPLKNKTVISVTQKSVMNPTTSVTKATPVIKSTSNSQIKCVTEKDEINLTPLIRTKDDYIVKINDTEFHINVCNPLVSTANLKACQGSSACKIHHGGGEITQEISLGNPRGRPVNDKNRNVILQYKDGAPCAEDKGASISSNLTFVCNFAIDTGSPKFINYTDCTYLFKWETRYVCGVVVGYFYDNCTISNPLSKTIDLSSLSKQTFYIKNNKRQKYSISMCGEKNFCNNSTVCQGENGYGSSVNVIFEYPNDSVKLQYTKGAKCSTGNLESEIRFICNSTAGLGTPEFIWESECSVHFVWQTSMICTPQMNTSTKNPPVSNGIKDREAPLEVTSNHGVLLIFTVTGIVIIVTIVLLLRNPGRRARCYRFFSNPCTSSSNDRVNTTEEARLLLDNCDPTTVCQSDSDDDLLGV